MKREVQKLFYTLFIYMKQTMVINKHKYTIVYY